MNYTLYISVCIFAVLDPVLYPYVLIPCLLALWQSEAKLESKEESQMEGEGRPSLSQEQKLAMQ